MLLQTSNILLFEGNILLYFSKIITKMFAKCRI